MWRGFVAILLGACGRIGFDASPTDGLASGHDEDGDGTPDVADRCPHLPGSQADQDGDGVGDSCDPEPAMGRQRLVVFAAMENGMHPFDTGGGMPWTPGPDALHFDGAGYAALGYPMQASQGVRVALGIDIVGIPDPMEQHQLSVHVVSSFDDPREFAELNEYPGAAYAGITHFDGRDYFQIDTMDLASGIHTGSLFMQTTITTTPSPTIRIDVEWPGEPYSATAATPSFAPGVFAFGAKNVTLAVRYLVLIETM